MNPSDAPLLLGGHGVVLPIVGPLVAGALILLLERARSRWAARLGLASTLALLLLAAALVRQADGGAVQPYLLGNWQAPWGIALALDRLAALMLLLTAAVATGALVYAMAGEHARGPHFHSLFQFQLMGLNGAFLTADLFNLFVFFEVLLAASYGLLLHGANRARLQASVHYVTFNLTGSALFLIAVSLLYGVTGTLNMADLAVKLAALPPQDLRLAQAAALMLLVVFAVKAALLPLYFWLPDTYAAASPPVAALFAIMTKVGVYAIARTTTLVFGGPALAGIATPMLPLLALGTLVLAAIGVLAARRLRALVAYLVVASAGTLLLAVGLGTAGTLAAGLFYLVNSTLVAAAWFLLADRVAAARGGSDRLEPSALAGGPVGWAPLGVAYLVAAVAMAGVPPLAGFLGKPLTQILEGLVGFQVRILLDDDHEARQRARELTLREEPAVLVVAPDIRRSAQNAATTVAIASEAPRRKAIGPGPSRPVNRTTTKVISAITNRTTSRNTNAAGATEALGHVQQVEEA